MRIGERQIDAAAPPYVIAEVGVNHDGSVDRARELVDAARETGAHAVKFQSFSTDRLLSRSAPLAEYQARRGAPDARGLLAPLELDVSTLAALVEHAQRTGLHAIVTEFCVESVAETASLPWDAFKVASPDLVNRPLIEALVATGRPLVISTGAATLAEIERTTEWLRDADVMFLHCVSAYPTPEESASLAGIRAVESATGRPAGYSDHTLAVDTGGLAIAAGACALEKHITWSRDATGPDHAASLDPQRFGQYVTLARRAWRMRGDGVKDVLAVEQDVRRAARQSVTTTRSLGAGTVLAAGDLTVKRPGTGLEPWQLGETIGRTLARAVEADQPLVAEDLA